jgi:hypothetical protein
MLKIFAPGCALMIYKPHLAEKIHSILIKKLGRMDLLQTCCKREPRINGETEIINICPGCDKRFRNDYQNISTVSLWEILAGSDNFYFPDYEGKVMTIIDACPTRNQSQIHKAIRDLLKRMNIALVEPEKTMSESTCCGDTFYGSVSASKVKQLMIKKGSEMPEEDIVVYCVSCSKAMFVAGRKPHYLIDLLFNEPTIPKTFEPDEWHSELENYIEKH